MEARLITFCERLLELAESHRPSVVVTLMTAAGHCPQDPGAKAIITSEGLHWGTVGGGKVEARAIARATAMLQSAQGTPVVERWDLQRDLGMTCGGAVTLAFEPHLSEPWRIAVFGAGHVVQALIPLLLTLDCRITCIDPRDDWLAKLGEHRRLRKVCVPELGPVMADLPPRTFVVCATQGHTFDIQVLREALKRDDIPYIGVIGSVTKGRALRATLLREGFREERVCNFRTPMGLPIGSNDPAEIAISIAGELLQSRDEKRRDERPHNA